MDCVDCVCAVNALLAKTFHANSGRTARATQFAADTRSHRLCVLRASAFRTFPFRSFVRSYQNSRTFAFVRSSLPLAVPGSGFRLLQRNMA